MAGDERDEKAGHRTPPDVECDRQHPAPTVSDVAAAAEFYRAQLGFRLAFTWGEPMEMAGVNLGTVQVVLERGTPRPDGCAVYFVVGNADALYEYQRDAGVEVIYPPGDREYGLRDDAVRDLDGTSCVSGTTRSPTARQSKSSALTCR